MIIPMSKYSFLIYAKEHEQFLEKLKKLGVVHVHQNNDVHEVENIKQILLKKKELQKMMEEARLFMKEYGAKDDQIPETAYSEVKEGEAIVQAYKQVKTQINEVEKRLETLQETYKQQRPWGEFDPKMAEKLAEQGVVLQFWMALKSAYDEAWEEQYNAVMIEDNGRNIYFVTVAKEPIPAKRLTDAVEVEIPRQTLTQLRGEQKRLKEKRKGLYDDLASLASRTDELEAYMDSLEETYRMDDARLQGVSMYDDQLIVLEGWTPEENAPQMESALDEDGYAYIKLEIGEDEEVPIKLKNNFFNRAFEPLIRMFSLPNYYEIDPTPLVAPFFMLFFALCFGDGGYGLVVLIAATIAKRKVDESKKTFATLFQYLGGAAMVVSFFAGTFFGVEYAKMPFLQKYKAFFLSQDNLMVLSIVLGFVQIILGKFVSSYKLQKQKGFKFAASHYAWAFLIPTLLIFFGLPMFDIQLPQWATYVMYGIFAVCLLFIFFYNKPGKNIFVNFGSGIWESYNQASGLLGDSLSYIRLFAIGLSGAILGGVFNQLAFELTEGLPGLVRWLPMLLILVIGHGINFAITMIGALVHPIRLIFVEYFNNSEYEGGGIEYKPLQKLGREGLSNEK